MPTPGPLTVYRRAAMASDFEVSLNATRDDFGAEAALDALDEIDRIEEILTVFRPTSTVARINLLASEMNIRVDDEFWGWLRESIRFSQETEGAFDVAAAPLWRAWGFAKRDGEFPKPDVLRRALEKSGVRRLRLDDAEQTIAFDEEGVELNFGAIGKGIALDAAARKLDDGGVANYLIQGGKSGVVARGGRENDERFLFDSPEDAALFDDDSNCGTTFYNNGAPEGDVDDSEFDEESGRRKRSSRRNDAAALDALLPSFMRPDAKLERRAAREKATKLSGWTIGVAHPLFPEKRLGEIHLRDRALATSGSTYQFFRSGGKRYSHVVDPRTGLPVDDVLSTTVLASTATEADALSTAFFVLGPQKTAEYCARRPDVAALFVLERESAPGFELRTFNLSPDVFRRVDG